MFYKVTLGFTTGATYNMTNVHVFKAAQARRAYFLGYGVAEKEELLWPLGRIDRQVVEVFESVA